MKAIIDQLNADVPGLGLTYDGVTESVDATVEAIKKAAKRRLIRSIRSSSSRPMLTR